MKKIIQRLICTVLFVFGCQFQLHSTEKKANGLPRKLYTLSVCATFKNEAKYLKEWIEYHLLVGVDHFFLYNIRSHDNFLKILSPYIAKNLVTLINWHDWNINREENVYEWALGVQIPAYENALQFLAHNKTKWIVFLNVHEFLVAPAEGKIADVLKEYDEYPGIVLDSNCYDASQNKYATPPRKLLIQTVELTQPLLENPQKEITKCIFKPDCCQGFTWPPYRCVFKNLQIPKVINKSKLHINHYLHPEGLPNFRSKRERLFIDHLTMTDEEMNQILSSDYEIEDLNPEMRRFIPDLAEKLGYNLGWGF